MLFSDRLFRASEPLVVRYQGRRASRLPLAIIFRAFGAPLRTSYFAPLALRFVHHISRLWRSASYIIFRAFGAPLRTSYFRAFGARLRTSYFRVFGAPLRTSYFAPLALRFVSRAVGAAPVDILYER